MTLFANLGAQTKVLLIVTFGTMMLLGAGLASLASAQDNPPAGQADPSHTSPDDGPFNNEDTTDPDGEPPPNGFRPTIEEQPIEDPALPKPKAPDVSGVVLGGLDKIAARTAKFEVNMGKRIEYNTLLITAHACKTRPPEEPPESAAYLEIQERKSDGTQAKLFSGWMFASSPALNALEHPIYDVWVVSCKTSRPDSATPGGPNS